MLFPVVTPCAAQGRPLTASLQYFLLPKEALKKKSQSFVNYLVREGVARDEWKSTYINTNENENEADLLTKVLPNVAKSQRMCQSSIPSYFSFCGERI
jgi:hypothetical protein